MADAIIPILDDIVARGVIKLLARRPSAGPFVLSAKGRYFDLFAGWKAQLALLRERLADECASRRLPTAEGRALVELAASEYFAELLPEATTAVGSISLLRTEIGAGPGVIKEGTRLKLSANPSASPPVKEARYVTTEPRYIDFYDSVIERIPIRATSPGTDANIPRYEGGVASPLIEFDDDIYDPTFEITACDAAGGSSGAKDADVRALASALYLGQFAPTDGALIAGVLTDAAVKHVAIVRDTALGIAILFVADESWAWSLAFQNQCKQVLKDDWLGWGARLDVRPIYNRLVSMRATIVLADPKFKDDSAELTSAVREAVRSYLDDRPDFYTFDLNALGAAVASCDERILTCSAVSLVELNTGAYLAPSPISASSSHINRYLLTDNAVVLYLTTPF